MVEGFVSFLFLGVIVFGFMFLYKKRATVAKWLEDPDMASDSDLKTQRMSLEHKIAVGRRKLEIMDEMVGKDSK